MAAWAPWRSPSRWARALATRRAWRTRDEEADAKLEAVLAFTREHAERVGLARSADEVTKLHEKHKVAIILSFLNARSIGTVGTGYAHSLHPRSYAR